MLRCPLRMCVCTSKGAACHPNVSLRTGEAERIHANKSTFGEPPCRPPRDHEHSLSVVRRSRKLKNLPSSQPRLLPLLPRPAVQWMGGVHAAGPMLSGFTCSAEERRREGKKRRKSSLQAWHAGPETSPLPQPKASTYSRARIDVPHQFHPELGGNILRRSSIPLPQRRGPRAEGEVLTGPALHCWELTGPPVRRGCLRT